MKQTTHTYKYTRIKQLYHARNYCSKEEETAGENIKRYIKTLNNTEEQYKKKYGNTIPLIKRRYEEKNK